MFEVHAREKAGGSPEWRVCRWEALPHGRGNVKPLYFDMTGAQYEPMARGKRKGTPNYRKPVAGTERRIIISVEEHDRWLLEWEARTGSCHECDGTGKEVTEMNFVTGETKYRDCRRCDGTGKRLVATLSPESEGGSKVVAQGQTRHSGDGR